MISSCQVLSSMSLILQAGVSPPVHSVVIRQVSWPLSLIEKVGQLQNSPIVISLSRAGAAWWGGSFRCFGCCSCYRSLSGGSCWRCNGCSSCGFWSCCLRSRGSCGGPSASIRTIEGDVCDLWLNFSIISHLIIQLQSLASLQATEPVFICNSKLSPSCRGNIGSIKLKYLLNIDT